MPRKLTAMRLRRCARVAALTSAALCLLSGGFDARQQPAAERVAAGARLFAPSCSSSYCHGKEGAGGGGGPALRDRSFTAAHLARVISEGVPGTAMPGFKTTYTPDQIRQLVAYVLSLSPGKAEAVSAAEEQVEPAAPAPPPPPTAPGAPAPLINAADLRGDAAAGRMVFFDAAVVQNCRVCHTVRGQGGRVGPDLSGVAAKPAREILQSIVLPHASVDPAYAAVAVTMRDGERVVGVKRDENDEVLRVYDTATLPPISRALLKSQVRQVERLTTSAMPHDYASRLTLKQLLDLVAFLKAESGVSLKDLF